MKSKEKAKELVDKYLEANDTIEDWKSNNIGIDNELAKQCALIAVDEVIDNIEDDYMHYELDWWQEVKQEINKL